MGVKFSHIHCGNFKLAFNVRLTAKQLLNIRVFECRCMQDSVRKTSHSVCTFTRLCIWNAKDAGKDAGKDALADVEEG